MAKRSNESVEHQRVDPAKGWRMTFKEAIEKALGLAPAIDAGMRSEMKYASRRLRSLERTIGLRDDPPTANPDHGGSENRLILHAKAD